jgi:hypothetical protein
MRTYYVVVAVIGLFVLAFGLWVFENGLIDDRIAKVETFQDFDVLGVKERHVFPVYAHPNEGVGSTQGGYDMYILVNYRNVNGTNGHLRVEDYYSAYGSLSIVGGQRLAYHEVVDSGSIVFGYSYSYVGLHWIALEPDYVPGYSPPIEVDIYTAHYEPSLKTDIILYGSTLGLVGAILASVGISVAICETKRRE